MSKSASAKRIDENIRQQDERRIADLLDSIRSQAVVLAQRVDRYRGPLFDMVEALADIDDRLDDLYEATTD